MLGLQLFRTLDRIAGYAFATSKPKTYSPLINLPNPTLMLHVKQGGIGYYF